MAIVSIQNVHKVFNKTHALNGVSLELERGQQYVIHGASGSGKSTLMYLMGGLDRPSQGKVVVDGSDLSKMTDRQLANYRNLFVGFVFQFHFLLPSIKCWDNLLLPSQIAGKSTREIRDRMKALAGELGVEHCLDKYPYELSGGEQQRINIIRALSMRPKLLLCDEPTGNLDSKNSEKVTGMLKQLALEFEATLVVVTHDPMVGKFFDRAFYIRDGQLQNSEAMGPPPIPPV